MANASTAQGTITITANIEEAVTSLVNLLRNAEGFGYPTYLYTENISISENSEDQTYYTSFPFNGMGRWTYQNNAENILSYLEDYLDDFPPNTLDLLTASSYTISIEWNEYELGNNFLSHGVATHAKKAGDPATKTHCNISEVREDPITVENLENYSFDPTEWVDYSPEGIRAFLDYFAHDTETVKELSRYSVKELAANVRPDNFIDRLDWLESSETSRHEYRDYLLEKVKLS